MIAGMLFHALAYGYLRGKLMMRTANFIQFINLGVVPILGFVFFHSVNNVLLCTGILWVIISLAINLVILFRIEWQKSELRSSSKQLLIYGIQRVPGDLLLAGFLALPAYFIAHIVNDNLKTAGYVAFAMSLLSMAGAAFGPICLMLLPKASLVIMNKDFALLNQYIKKIVFWTTGLTLLGIIFVEVFAKQLISLYLGNAFDDLVLCVRIIMPASFGYTLYISLRSILDAYYVKAVNTKNIIISFLIFFISSVVCYFVQWNYFSILYSFVAGMLVMGFLTFYETKKVVKQALQNQ